MHSCSVTYRTHKSSPLQCCLGPHLEISLQPLTDPVSIIYPVPLRSLPLPNRPSYTGNDDKRAGTQSGTCLRAGTKTHSALPECKPPSQTSTAEHATKRTQHGILGVAVQTCGGVSCQLRTSHLNRLDESVWGERVRW